MNDAALIIILAVPLAAVYFLAARMLRRALTTNQKIGEK